MGCYSYADQYDLCNDADSGGASQLMLNNVGEGQNQQNHHKYTILAADNPSYSGKICMLTWAGPLLAPLPLPLRTRKEIKETPKDIVLGNVAENKFCFYVFTKIHL